MLFDNIQLRVKLNKLNARLLAQAQLNITKISQNEIKEKAESLKVINQTMVSELSSKFEDDLSKKKMVREEKIK